MENKRKKKYINSYSNVSQRDAESTLKIRLSKLIDNSKDIDEMIKGDKEITDLKKVVLDRLIDSIESEGFPETSIEPFKEIVVHDFIGDVLKSIIAYYKRKNLRESIFLLREKEIISKDEDIGGNIEFVVVDTILVNKDRYILVIEAKRDALGKGLVQCLLSLRDAYDANDDNKTVYGFITTGVDWKLISYNKEEGFQISDKVCLLFASMPKRREKWMKENSKIIDVIYKILEISN